MHSTCPLAPKLDSRRSVVSLSLKAASTFTDSTPCTNVPLKCIFCTPEVWVWKYSTFHHVDQKHTSALALSKSDPNTVRFKESYNVGKVETDAMAGKLRKCKIRRKGRTARAPAPRRKVAPMKESVPAPIARTETSQQKGGSGDSDESHGSKEGSSGEEEYSDKEDSDDGRNSEDEDVDEREEGEEGEEKDKGGGKGKEKEGEEEEEEQEEKKDILSSRGRSRTR